MFVQVISTEYNKIKRMGLFFTKFYYIWKCTNEIGSTFLYINAGQLNVNKQIEIEKNLSDSNNSLVRTAHHNIKTGNLLLQLPRQNFGSNS
jgi:hypothetical protein